MTAQEGAARSKHLPAPTTRRTNRIDFDRVGQGARSTADADLRGLTFELTGRQRQATKARLAKMYRVPPAGSWCPAVGAPVERGVRQRSRPQPTLCTDSRILVLLTQAPCCLVDYRASPALILPKPGPESKVLQYHAGCRMLACWPLCVFRMPAVASSVL